MNNKIELIDTMKELIKYQKEEIKQLKSENNILNEIIFIIPKIQFMTGETEQEKNKKRKK